MQAMLYSAANGVGLALVIPCVQSLTADYNPPEMRGRAFGVMFFTSALGGAPASFHSSNSSQQVHDCHCIVVRHVLPACPRGMIYQRCYTLAYCTNPATRLEAAVIEGSYSLTDCTKTANRLEARLKMITQGSIPTDDLCCLLRRLVKSHMLPVGHRRDGGRLFCNQSGRHADFGP
jgi:hypothetical protein